MALDFPASPTNGQIYEQYVYDSALPGWRSKGGAVAATYVSDTAPSGAVKGDMWYRSSDGTTYVFVVDANSSQWVEIRSEISTAQVGLVPIVPTSVVLGSGSASVSVNGTVTFTGASSVSLNGTFNTTYNNYRYVLKIRGASSGTTGIVTRFRASGTNTSTGYYWAGYIAYTSVGTFQRYAGDNAAELLSGFLTGSATTASSVDVFSPWLAEPTLFTTQSVGSDGNYFTLNNSGFQISSTQFDGISFVATSNTFTGTVKVYGYN
jgi:hypothetical protein